MVYCFNDIARSFSRVNRDAYLIYIYHVYVYIMLSRHYYSFWRMSLMAMASVLWQDAPSARSTERYGLCCMCRGVRHVSWACTWAKKHDPAHKKSYIFLPIVHNSLSAEVHQAQFIHAHKHKTHVNNRHIHLSMICVFLLFLRGKNGLALNAAFGHITNCCCLKRAGSAYRLELKSHLLKNAKTTRGGSCKKHVSQCVYLIVLRGG